MFLTHKWKVITVRHEIVCIVDKKVINHQYLTKCFFNSRFSKVFPPSAQLRIEHVPVMNLTSTYF
jgi:hypothetical protein